LFEKKHRILMSSVPYKLFHGFTTGNAAFAVRSNLCRASFIGCTAMKLSAVR
jgi:hypothetical protein